MEQITTVHQSKENPIQLNQLRAFCWIRTSYTPIKSLHLYTVTYYTHLFCLHNVFNRASVPVLYLWTYYNLIPAKVHSH